MRTGTRPRKRAAGGVTAAGTAVVVAAAVAVVMASGPPEPEPEARDGHAAVEGGRLSHLCRAGLWVMGTGHVATGGVLMWLGC
jgi:hypothetical protein